MDLDELLAREQIRDALARYVRGMDRLDLELALSAFHPGAVDHHGRNSGDPAEIFPLIMQRLRDHAAGSHLLGSSAVRFLADGVAAVETVALGFHRIRGTDGGFDDVRIGLRYVDRFERRHGEWRIAERHVVEDWRRSDPVLGPGVPGAFEAGLRDPGDRSYLIGL